MEKAITTITSVYSLSFPSMFKLSSVQVGLILMSISTLAASTILLRYTVIEPRGTVSLSLLYFIQESFSILFYSKNATVNVDICTGNPSTGCVEILINSGNLINLDGGLVFFNKQISSAIIPTGLCKDCLHIFRVSSTFHILPL